MKENNLIIKIGKIYAWILLVIPIFCVSCINDGDGTGGSDSDSIANIKLTVQTDTATQVTTRTSSSTESKVSNLHILIFNSSGKLVGKKYSSTTDTTVTISTRQGTNYSIYAIANTNDSTFFKNIGTLTLFKNKLSTLDVNTYPLMCGSLSGQSVSGKSVSISGLKLTRMFAKVTLNVTAASGITITGYQFCNIATSAYLDRDSAAGITWANQTAVSTSSISGVTNYMYGNPQGTVTHSDQTYKGTGAPSNASYILLTATQSGVTATYKIYLGGDNSSDYNVYRNYSYTYNISLTSLYTADTRITINSSATTQTSSNCYCVTPGSSAFAIPVNRANADGTTRLSSTTSGWSCGLLWTDNSNGLSSSGAVSSIVADAANARIIVTPGSSKGNAIVYVKNSSGTIVWSWHIWVTDAPSSYTNSTLGYTYMDRNLGATSTTQATASTLGLLYQWGRKDPFPGAATISQSDNGSATSIYNKSGTSISISQVQVTASANLENSINNPATWYCGTSTNGYDWYSNTAGTHNSSLWSTTKTVYDPCPNGWKMPPIAAFSSLSSYSYSSWNYGYTFTATNSFYFPAPGDREHNTGNINNVGVIGFYWSTDVNNGAYSNFYSIASSGLGSSAQNFGRAYGFSVRCVK